MRDEATYGFGKPDAEDLLTKIGLRDELTQGRRPGRSRGGGGGVTRLVLTPGGGIAARSGTTVSSASCTEYKNVSGTLTTNTNSLTVYNLWPVAIPAGYYILAKKEQITGTWFAEFPGVVNVNWNSPDLRQTWDGTNYSNVDTAEAC